MASRCKALLVWKESVERNEHTKRVLSSRFSANAISETCALVLSSSNPDQIDIVSYFAELAGFKAPEEFNSYIDACFAEHFSHIRLYHSCRPIDLGSYLKRGIEKANIESLIRHAKQLWLASSEISDEERIRIFRAMDDASKIHHSTKQKVYLVVDDLFLVRRAGHYLINGSEFLLSIAVRIGKIGGCSAVDDLRRLGVPTMIACDVPISLVRPQLRVLWRELVYDFLRHSAGLRDAMRIDYAIALDHVAPEYLSEHYHPLEIPDPHDGGTIYRSECSFCPYCKQ